MASRWRDPARRLVLKVEAWPAADREAWGRALAPGDLLDGDGPGPAAGWSAAARRKRRVSYGRWLGFLARTGRLGPDGGAAGHAGPAGPAGPAGRATREHLAAYLGALTADCAPVTAWSYVADLAAVLGALDPGGDRGRVRRLAARLRARMRPSVDRARLVVPPARLYREGIAMMAEAGEAEESPTPAAGPGAGRRRGANRTLAREVLYRDGLLVALLAACPLRRRSLAALEAGRHLVRHADGRHRLRLGPADTKDGAALDAPLPVSLAPWLDRYLAEVRPRLLGGRAGTALWISRDGTAMTVNSLSRRVEAATGRRLGRRMGPHLFRHCAATGLALEAPDLAREIPALLGHRRPATGERYYNLAGAAEAAGEYQARLAALRRRLRAEAGRGGPGGRG